MTGKTLESPCVMVIRRLEKFRGFINIALLR